MFGSSSWALNLKSSLFQTDPEPHPQQIRLRSRLEAVGRANMTSQAKEAKPARSSSEPGNELMTIYFKGKWLCGFLQSGDHQQHRNRAWALLMETSQSKGHWCHCIQKFMMCSCAVWSLSIWSRGRFLYILCAFIFSQDEIKNSAGEEK